jgi:hypothetical protein
MDYCSTVAGAGGNRELGGERHPVRHNDIADGDPGADIHLRHSAAESRILSHDHHERHLPW